MGSQLKDVKLDVKLIIQEKGLTENW